MISLAERRIHKVLIGQVVITRRPNVLSTVLGSCIGVVLYEPGGDLAGMAHVLLPDSAGKTAGDLPGKFADWAVPCLIDSLTRHGVLPRTLRAKIAGGARMFTGSVDYQDNDVGTLNVRAVEHALEACRIPIVARDTGGGHGRRMDFDLAQGSAQVEDFAGNRRLL